MNINTRKIFSIALLCSTILQSKTQGMEKDQEKLEERTGHYYQVSCLQEEEEEAYGTVIDNPDKGSRRKRQRTASISDEGATTTTSISADNPCRPDDRGQFNELGILSTTSSAGRMSTLAEFEKFFHEGVSRLASNLPLSLGDLEQNEKGEWYQIIAGQKATQTVGSVSTSLTYNVTFKCSTETRRKGWKHDDSEKKSYEELSVIARKGKEVRDTNTTIVGDIKEYTYLPENTSVRLISAVLNSDKFNILINKQYSRADLTKYSHQETIESYLTLTHVNFRHINNFSYQIVCGWFTDGKQSHPVQGMENYVLESRRYGHQIESKPDHWDDDKENHHSTRMYRVLVNPQGAYTPEKIDPAHTYVGYIGGERVNHERSLFGLGSSYTIPWSNKKY